MRVQKDGTAYWLLGSIIEVTVHDGNHDPNRYHARCLTGGTFPTIQVLDEKYPEPITGRPQDPPFVVWREVAESAEDAENADDAENVDVTETVQDTAHTEQGLFVIVGQDEGTVCVMRKGDDTPVAGSFASVESATAWLGRNKCADCGLLYTDDSPGCGQRHIGVPKAFSF
jgi:hypothetical protein